MFRPILTKRDTFWTARPKHLGLDQVRLSEFCFDRHDYELLCFYQVQPSEIRFDRCDQNIYVSTKFDEARYVSTGATKTIWFRPILTQFDRGRYVSTGETKTSEFEQVRPSEICFDRHDHKLLCSDQVRPGEIRFDQRNENIYVSTKFDQASYVSTGATKTFMFRPSSTKFDQARYVSTGATKLSRFRPSSTERDTFRPARPKHQCFDHVRPSEILFDRRDQNV